MDKPAHSVDREVAHWVLEPRVLIRKSNFTFAAKFIRLLVCHCLSPTAADNIPTWDRTVLVAAMVAGFEVYFPRLLLTVIHERVFKASTTYPFPCMIFELGTFAGVPNWHIDVFKTSTRTVDIGVM